MRKSPQRTAAAGLKVNSLKLLEPVKQKVFILQKSLWHTPAQKLQDAFIAILAGANALSEINTRVRNDEALQLLDVDMTGVPCGANQEGSRKGYFREKFVMGGRSAVWSRRKRCSHLTRRSAAAH